MKTVTLVTALLLLCGFASGQQTFCSAQSSCTVTGQWNFTNPVVDNSSTTLNASFFTGADVCAKASNACSFAATAGWTSVFLDAGQRIFLGQQHCTTNPFAGCTNNGTMTGKLSLRGTQLVMDVPIIIPGGFHLDGNGPRSFANPPRNFAGTAIQPSATYDWANGPLVQLGSSTDTSSPQGVMVENLAVGCVPPGQTYNPGVTPPAGSTGIFNGNAQEMSGAQFVQIENCPVSYDVEQLSSSPVHSGFDSFGLKHSTILVPYDPAAIGIQCGGGLNGGIAGLSHINGFDDNTITGTPCSGATCSNGTGGTAGAPLNAPGIGIDLNCSDVSVRGNRFAYVGIPIRAGFTNSAQNVHVDVADVTSNNSNAWTTLVDLEAHADWLEVMDNIMPSGTGVAGAQILKDVNYPGGTCSLVQNNASTGDAGENGLARYSRGIGGGVNGVIISSAKTGTCLTKNLIPNVASTATANTFTSGTQQIGAENGISTSLKVAATNTATTGANFPSNPLSICGNFNNGTTSTDVCSVDTMQIGSGTTPSGNRYVAAPTNAPAGTALNLGGPAANQIWGFVNVGGSLGNTTLDVTGPIKHFTSGQTFSVTVSQPTVTASRTNTWPDAGGTITVAPAAVTTGRATCWKGTGQIGYCSTQPDATGACTCN